VKVVAAAAITAGAVTAVAGGIAGAGDKPVQEDLTVLVGELSCPDGDLIMTRIAEVAFPENNEENDGAATAEEALSRVLESSYKKLDKTKFEKTSEDEKHALLELKKDNKKRFITSARKFDEGWAITGFVACNSTLVEAQ